MTPKSLAPSAILKLTREGIDSLDSKYVESALDLICKLYSEHPAKGYDRDEDGDMLLFQYGVFDWGQGKNFEIDFTRQFYKPENIVQLRCTLYFEPEQAKKLSAWNLWSSRHPNLDSWRNEIVRSAGFQAATSLKPERFRIELEKQ